MSTRSFTEGVIEFVKAHEGQWIDAIRFEQFGRQAWRTRISDARKRLQTRGEGTIENRVLIGSRGFKHSQYRYVRPRPASLLAQMEQPSV